MRLSSWIAVLVLMTCLLSCIRFDTLGNSQVNDVFCDSCDRISSYYFFDRYYLEGEEEYLDSAINTINLAIPKCVHSDLIYDFSIRKLAALCGKKEYDQAISFLDSIDFRGHDHSCYKQVVFNRIHAMKCQSMEDIAGRNLYLQGIAELLQDFLAENKSVVDSVWLNIDDKSYDSLLFATTQYYYYLSVLNGEQRATMELDSLYSNGRMNMACLERLKRSCNYSCRFMVFLGL